MKSSTKKVVYSATFIALIFVALMLDTWVGSFMPIKPAIFSLPAVFVFVLIFGSWQYAVLGGLSFGLLSFARAFITGSLPFQNPLVSILPRILVGVVAYAVYLLCKKLFAKCSKGETFALGISSLIGVITNTVTVLFMMYFTDFTTLAGVFSAIVSINFPFEIVVTVVLTPVIVLGVRRGLKLGVDKPVANTVAVEVVENTGDDEQ